MKLQIKESDTNRNSSELKVEQKPDRLQFANGQRKKERKKKE
jgi:hypothetical protein